MFKVGIAVLGGSCLVFLSVLAVSSYTDTTVAEPTNLLGMPTALRATPTLPMSIQNLPGAPQFKELAWAAMQGSARCSRDMSMRAAPVKAVWNRMSSADKDLVVQTSKAVVAKAESPYVGYEKPLAADGAVYSSYDIAQPKNKEANNPAGVFGGFKEAVVNVPRPDNLLGPGDAEKILNGAGVSGPLGFFDPSGLSTDITEGRLLFFREAELKHGRLCMLAFLGIVVGENYHPLFGGEIDIPAGKHFTAISTDSFWFLAYIQNIFAIGFEERRTSLPHLDGTFLNGLRGGPGESDEAFIGKKSGNRLPGDIGFDPLGLKPKKEKELVELQTKELNNGRLAMVAVAGILAQEAIYGEKIFG